MSAETIGRRRQLGMDPGIHVVFLAFSVSEKRSGGCSSTFKMPYLEEYCSINTTVFIQGQTHRSILNCGILQILCYQTQSGCVKLYLWIE
jgi:hypothetical protein